MVMRIKWRIVTLQKDYRFRRYARPATFRFSVHFLPGFEMRSMKCMFGIVYRIAS